MKTNHFKRLQMMCIIMQFVPVVLIAQGIQEYASKTSKDKIKKSILVAQSPVTAGGFSDGHGRNPVLTSKDQIPDTIALITFYINDFGTVKSGPYTISSYWLGSNGGNVVANELERKSVQMLKESFSKQGIVLLTPSEFLNTKEKRDYYYKNFSPKASKMAKFLSNVETSDVAIAAGADYYRSFDISVSWDAIRAESLVNDLGKKLGINGLLTIAVNIQSDKKDIYITGMRMALNGPNPIPKEDKNYVAQNMGNGYYYGQSYTDCNFGFPKPALIGKYENVKTTSKKTTYEGPNSYSAVMTKSAEILLDVSGIETIAETLVEKTFETMHEAIEKAATKYKK